MFRQHKTKATKGLAILVDPDKYSEARLEELLFLASAAGVDYIFVGGSILLEEQFGRCMELLTAQNNIPVVLFPGSPAQVNGRADAMLLLSLISGRNPELLIGQHVLAAPKIKASRLEVISTGYMLVDGGMPTAVSYISNTQPLPANKPELAACTAMAGEMLGLQCMYLEAGSGAADPVPAVVIKATAKAIDVPLIVGGGIAGYEAAKQAYRAGADIVVVGNAVEQDLELIAQLKLAATDIELELKTTGA